MQNSLKQSTPQPSTPIERLVTLLADDMAAVNQTILGRMTSDVPLIQQIAAYLISAGGKRIRPLLTLASCRLFMPCKDTTHSLATAVEFIHTATLLHDDVVDESNERRGKPSANETFGNQASVLVGDFLFSRSFQLMVESDDIRILKSLADASAIIAQGEVLQLTMAGSLDMTRSTYFKIIEAKTAALFAAACESGALSAKAEDAQVEALKAYGTNLGLAFQIIDDVIDYTSTTEDMGKTAGDDFREGKVTLPLLIAIEKTKDQHQALWTRAITEQNASEQDLKDAIKIMTDCGAFDLSIDIAKDYSQAAIDCLRDLPESEIKLCLSDLPVSLLERLS